MPRKNNGFGNTRSFAVNGANKVNHRTDKGKGRGAFGSYPSDRRFGSTVSRSVIEQYDLESTWARWRRGMEYYFQGAYLEFDESKSVIFPGTSYEIPVTFDGYRFATKNADSKTHYSIKRSVPTSKQLGYITDLETDRNKYPDQFARHEIWAKIIASREIESDSMLLRSEGERVQSGGTAANIQRVLTSERKPAVYTGKTQKDASIIRVTLELADLEQTDFIKENDGNLQALVGETVYMPDFYTERPITLFDQFTDFKDYISVDTADFIGGVRLEILDNSTTLPPSLLDIQDLTPIFKTDTAVGALQTTYIFQKSEYQRFFGQQYLTADVVRDQVQTISYSIMPWTIQSVLIDKENGKISLESVPFQSSAKMYTPSEMERWIIFPDNSFTYQTVDEDANGNYNHPAPKPGDQLWQRINISVDPWMDQIFGEGGPLVFADLYTCSCPAYLHALIRAPEVYDESNNTLNRQQRYPMPTAKGTTTYQGAGLNRASGIAESWATLEYKRGFKICKHVIASMFINKIRVEEPNTFPSVETRKKFEEKLGKDIAEVALEFRAQLERSEITTVEIVFALADALNLDEVELGYVLLTSNF